MMRGQFGAGQLLQHVREGLDVGGSGDRDVGAERGLGRVLQIMGCWETRLVESELGGKLDGLSRTGQRSRRECCDKGLPRAHPKSP